MNRANRDVESPQRESALGKRLLLAALSLIGAAAIWLPAVHLGFRPWHVPASEEAVASPLGEKLAARHLHLWTDPELRRGELEKMRATNAEWDFMGRSFTVEGRPLDGPEGSSLWMSAHCLELIDAPFAREQYRLARRELGERVCGFGFAREWPRSWQGPADVDSGPVIPLLNASAGSSGLALVGSRAFDDADYFASLLTTLNFAGFPHEQEGRLRYCAGNQVGDAVLLYSIVLGPAWREVEEGPSP